MELLPKEVRETLPPLYSQDGKGDNAVAYAKLFSADSCWTWYACEYDPEQELFFGLVFGLEVELGYFGLAELREVRGPLQLPVERDLYFEPKTLRQIRADHAALKGA